MRSFLMVFFLLPAWSSASAPKTETFIIQVNDRSVKVVSPDKRRTTFSVIVNNQSLSDQLGRFMVEGKLLQYVAVKSGKSETIEIENKTSSNVVFVPVSPAFQDVDLIFGKKAYEIPSKE